MDDLVKLVQSLPLPAVLVFAAVLAVIFGVRYLGLLQGLKAAPGGSETKAQVAAVIVDPTALNHATAAVEGLVGTVIESNAVARRHAEGQERVADRLERLTDAVDRLCDELIRSAAKL